MKLGLILAVIIIFTLFSIPSFVSSNKLPSFFPKNRVHLGLDLKGGVYLVLAAETDKAVNSVVAMAANNLKEELLNAKIAYDEILPKGSEIIIKLVDKNDTSRTVNLIEQNLTSYDVVSSSHDIIIRLKEKYINRIQEQAVEQAVGVIRNRIDQFGVVEPTITRVGFNKIVVELPGIKNENRAIRLIGQTARLTLHLVDDSVNVDQALAGNLPPDDEILYQIVHNPTTGEVEKIPMVVKKEPIITGSMIKKAYVSFGQAGQPQVSFELNSKGAKIFAQFTGSHIGKRLAIVLDNVIYSAPVIQTRIDGGRGVITGNFTLKQAHDLAIVLRSGSLPVPVKILEKVTIGPTLGKLSIKQSTTAMIVGSIMVVLFMAFYYKFAGILADFALAVNVLIIFGALAMFGATLTLPGIAGIALSIGMAVDANVLIYERVREELRLGRSVADAIELGYSRAWITIFDSNITTLIIALILYQFGSGPVKGFAVTMSIGLIANLFTAVTLTKTIYDIVLYKFKPKTLSI